MTTTPTPQRPDAREILDRLVKALRDGRFCTTMDIDDALAEYDALPAAPAVGNYTDAEKAQIASLDDRAIAAGFRDIAFRNYDKPPAYASLFRAHVIEKALQWIAPAVAPASAVGDLVDAAKFMLGESFSERGCSDKARMELATAIAKYECALAAPPDARPALWSAGFEAGWRECAVWSDRDDLPADIGSKAYTAQMEKARALAAPSDAPTEWRCFHCDEVFTDHAAALDHFGPSLCSEPACKIDAAEYRRMEEQVRRCNAEDSDKDRAIYALRAHHAVMLIREEERGYAKGLADAQPAQAVTDAPAIGSRWQHKNGNFYTVLAIANHASERPDEYPVTVVYRGDNGNTWSRKLSDWHRSMTERARPAHVSGVEGETK